MKPKHSIEAQQYDQPMLERFFLLTDEMKKVLAKGGSDMLHRKIMTTLFYEPSTRTRLSFESAMLRLGGQVMGTESASHFSSDAKGERFTHTIRCVSGFCDIIVLRYHTEGGAMIAAEVSKVPIINAGDGRGQHPTQARLDLYTIRDKRPEKRIEGLKIAMVGDLKNGRTVRSFSYLLAKFPDIKIYYVAPKIVQMKEDILDYLTRHKTRFEIEPDFARAAREVDVVYMTRLQRERENTESLPELEREYGKYVLSPEIRSCLKPEAIIMHPLPATNEIPDEVDQDPRGAYFDQSDNGVPTRMATLLELLT